MTVFVTQLIKKGSYNALLKSRNDIAYFLAEENVSSIPLKKFRNRVEKLFFSPGCVRKVLHHLSAGDTLIIQYPSQLGRRFDNMLMDQLIAAHIHTVALIHDLDSLRFKNNILLPSVKQEVEDLNCYDYVIASNKVMRKFLVNEGLKVPCGNLELFDYYHFGDVPVGKYAKTLNFAGNLNKARFLAKLHPGPIQVDIYGKSPSRPRNRELLNQGKVDTEILPSKLRRGFGLVWDGNSIEKVSGNFGNYLKINSPHKMSLYLSSGLPVVVWKKSALADFVIQKQCGLAVDSLSEAIGDITHMSVETYDNWSRNSQRIGEGLIKGVNTKRAVKAALASVQKKV